MSSGDDFELIQDHSQQTSEAHEIYIAPSNENVSPTNTDSLARLRRDEARRLIQDGDTLMRQGNLESARQKWTEGTEKGAGFPEALEAMQRLNNTQPTYESGG